MSRLIQRPDTPWNGFLDGAIRAGLGAGLPLFVIGMIGFGWSNPLRALAILLAMAGAFALLGGLGLALWRAIQGWAYDRISTGRLG